MSLLIKGGRILVPVQEIDRTGNIFIDGGKIARIGDVKDVPTTPGYEVIDAAGMVVCPGFIDLHCHLREPGFEQKETIATGVRAAAQGGFTTICCMPNTKPALDDDEIVVWVKNQAEKENKARVIPIPCVTMDRAGRELVNMESLAKLGIAGFSDDGNPVMPDIMMKQALTSSNKLNLPIVDHCEDPIGGPPEGEAKIVARDVKLAEEIGGWVHIAHVSTAASVELIQKAKSKGVKVTAEVTPHHLTMNEYSIHKYGTQAKVNPPLRSESDCRAVIQALHDGVIDIIATDHAPHTDADKLLDYAAASSGFSGFETAFGLLMSLVYRGKLTLQEVISCLTDKPARILGGRFGDLGCLKIGNEADIAIIDPDLKWIVDVTQFASKGKNTPCANTRLRGKVMATIYRSNLVFQDESIKTGLNK